MILDWVCTVNYELIDVLLFSLLDFHLYSVGWCVFYLYNIMLSFTFSSLWLSMSLASSAQAQEANNQFKLKRAQLAHKSNLSNGVCGLA